MEVMDAVDLVQVEEAAVRERVDPFAIIYSDLNIPAGAIGFEVRKTCRLEALIGRGSDRENRCGKFGRVASHGDRTRKQRHEAVEARVVAAGMTDEVLGLSL